MIYAYSHPHFTLAIYTSRIEDRQLRYAQTLQRRGEGIPICYVQINGEKQPLEYPIFFENSRYDIEWEFHQDVKNVQLNHKLNSVNNAFRFNTNKRIFIGSIETANDIGWFTLPLSYELNGEPHSFTFAFEVLPSKMDLNQDLPAMYQDIDTEYPLWRFNLAEKTNQNMSDSQSHEHFPLFWLAQFQRLQEEFAHSLNVIANSPHHRLQVIEKYQKAERIKGKVPERTAIKIHNDLKNGLVHKRYSITEKRLSADTPENRFVKMAVTRSSQILSKLERTLRKENEENDRLSVAFFKHLYAWQKPLQQMQHQPFMQQVGEFQGLMKESLVLQQRSGYSRVFQIWQELKHYLNLFENQTEISQKSVAEIYEVWCFLALRRCLLTLGFKEAFKNKANLVENADFSLAMRDGIRGAFHFEKVGIQIRLAHEPKFTKQNQTIRSFVTPQKPDIFLEITFPNQQRYIWLFDAKYRIKTEQEQGENDDIEHVDYVPDDAINQMHRYRDALILLSKNELNPKSRPVFGAFALYPGFFDQQKEKNPYQQAIEQVGIGAFALLPTPDGDHWLKTFLQEKLLGTESLQSQLLLQHEARIADHGTQQRLYPNLVLMMALGEDRSEQYISDFKQGKLKWYHTPVATFRLKIADYLASEIQFLALAFEGNIERIYPVKRVQKLKRSQITLEQAGRENQSDEEYYLFELNKPLRLEQPISGVPQLDEHSKGFRNSIKLTTLDKLDEAERFDEIEAIHT